MDTFADERDYQILERDKYTFFVLRRIMDGPCNLLLTNHERLIVCYSCAPYPVWVWTPDDATEAEMENAYTLVRENGLLAPGHTFNLKYDLAEYFIKRAAKDGVILSIQTNMLAYDCPVLIEPHIRADGELHRCEPQDLEELIELEELFHQEIGSDQNSLESYRRKAEEAIQNGSIFLWKNAAGKSVSICRSAFKNGLANIGLVYTRKADRRKHYAENLVYHVSKMARDAGYMPMLYTDADYAASNACYMKIGFVPQGRLCTIG